MVHLVQCQKDFPHLLFGGALYLGSEIRRTNGQLGGKKKQSFCTAYNEDPLLI